MTGTKPDERSGELRSEIPFRLGVFTRLVDDVSPAELYARALDLFETAERLGFDYGWVAQHHAGRTGGLPAPLVFLSAAAMRTRRLRLATGIVTLPLENPVRLAEDAAVLDALCGGRLELGFGTGGTEGVFPVFGRDPVNRQADYDHAFAVLRDALAGEPLFPGGPALFPPAAPLTARFWEATFGVEGAIRAAEHGSGLLLSRTQSRPAAADGGARAALDDVQAPIVEAYLQHFRQQPWSGQAPRIGLSRSCYVAPTRSEALADAEPGMRRYARLIARRDGVPEESSIEGLLARSDFHIGSAEDVIESLRADRLLASATDLILQVHPVDPPPEKALRSFALIATEVAPALGWRPAQPEPASDLASPSRGGR